MVLLVGWCCVCVVGGDGVVGGGDVHVVAGVYNVDCVVVVSDDSVDM